MSIKTFVSVIISIDVIFSMFFEQDVYAIHVIAYHKSIVTHYRSNKMLKWTAVMNYAKLRETTNVPSDKLIKTQNML